MNETAAIVVGSRNIKIFKRGRALRCDLQVSVHSRGCHEHAVPRHAARWVAFPASLDCLDLGDLEPANTYEVVLRRRNLLHRLRMKAPRWTLQLGPRPLRLVLIGSGRCGTQTFAHFLDGMRFADGTPVIAWHEPLSEYVVPALLDGQLDLVRGIQQGLGHNVEVSPYYALYPAAIAAERVVHLIRDGRSVVQSGMNRGWYQNNSPWNQLKPRFEGDAFMQSCHYWRLACERSEDAASYTVRLEDLSRSGAAREDFLRRVAIEPDGRPFPHANRGSAPASWTAWTPRQREVFTEIASPVMDRHYAGWQTTW